MRLMEIVKQLDTLDLDAIICVQRPWSPEAECIITLPAADFGVPAEVKEARICILPRGKCSARCIAYFWRECAHGRRENAHSNLLCRKRCVPRMGL
jgi:hypothetical protein